MPEREPSSQSRSSLWHLFLLGIGAWIGSKFKTLPCQQGIDSIQPKDNPNRTCCERQRETDSPVRVVIDSYPPSPTPPNEWTTEQNRKKWHDRWTLVVAIVSALIVFVYTSVTYRIWSSMQEQTRIQREQIVTTQRAWLGLDNPAITVSALELTPQFRVIANIHIKNFGHGPAFKIATSEWVTPDSDEMEQWAKNSCEQGMVFTEGRVRVGKGIPQPPPMGRVLFPDAPMEKPLGQPQSPFIGTAAPNARFVFFVGCVTYKDQFGESHWTRFCWLTPEWGRVPINERTPLHMYGMYNDTDDEYKKKRN